MSKLTVYEFIEDFDNAELPHEEWMEQMEEAVETYNEHYNASHNPRVTVINYINRKKQHEE
jgi:hypothetical protein